MANAGHLQILCQGVEAWNEWRAGNPDVVPDLSGGSSLSGVLHALRGLPLTSVRLDLRAVNFRDADLHNTILVSVDLQGANLRGAMLQEAIPAWRPRFTPSHRTWRDKHPRDFYVIQPSALFT
ncbi:MAG TPA: pentapeptide repeat-containing protein [Terriglobia bacterium]|nr:pentapeptide repeat-containing protein [Terriglobia bacterium]